MQAQDQCGPELIRQWTEQHAEVHAVRTRLTFIRTDSHFEQIEVGQGELSFRLPGVMRYDLFPLPPEELQAWTERQKTPYSVRSVKPLSLAFDANVIELRTVEETITASDGPDQRDAFSRMVRQWFFEPLRRSLCFLPGAPDKAILDDWSFRLERETAEFLYVEGTRKQNRSEKIRLCFQKSPLELHAIRIPALGGHSQTTLIFTEVRFHSSDFVSHDMAESSVMKRFP